jgi:plastocyanin
MPRLKRPILICAFAVAVYAPTVARETAAGDTSSDKPFVVTMKSLSFEPKKLEVQPGALIVWANTSRTKHSATSDDDGTTFDSGLIAPGESSKAVSFDKEGTFTYHCRIHGKMMSGTVVVKPATIVTMKSMSFDPKRFEVPVGASVVWANKAHSKHTATSDDDGKTFDTGEIKPGASSKPVKFEKEGEFKYHCLVHGKSMSGTIVVKAAEKR